MRNKNNPEKDARSLLYTSEQIVKISDCTSRFYDCVSASFSATREKPWDGWLKALPYLNNCLSVYCEKNSSDHIQDRLSFPSASNNLSNCGTKIVDIGCGNLRFEEFLLNQFPNLKANCCGIDKCKDLIQRKRVEGHPSFDFSYKEADIVKSLIEEKFYSLLVADSHLKNAQASILKSGSNNLVVAFGVLHHVPSEKLRLKLLQSSIESLDKGGLFIVSFWQLGKSDKLMQKASQATPHAKQALHLNSLEENDFFLSWQDKKDIYRFCHNFTDVEVKSIKRQLDAKILAEFSADGSDNNLNKYLVFQK